ncbi:MULTISPECIES: glycosyltransferase family A protein [unclassified Empedobacter]|uniref:glycosyltransferase family A protein n=1 Tax=unclassified Empedobacter TaxID=2643773 RepID=UPI0025BAA232|nr:MULTISPECIES: glycosyltransferase family 2 protein [unclassified Empedobacter]
MFLSIITATYNRAYCLDKIYNSLLTNDRNLFQWILVDDGSSDETELLAEKWEKEDKINFIYIKKNNGGKTSAIIEGFKNYPKGEFCLILDSDDYLEDNIIKKLKEESQTLTKANIGMIGLKKNSKNELIGTSFTCNESNYIDLYFGKNRIYGDKLFIIKTKLYSRSFIPPYPREKFIPDNIPYIKTNSLGLLKCLNYTVYIGDYLEDGMTANVLNMAAKNINGFILEKKMLQSEKLPLIEKIKNEVKYISYSLAANNSYKEVLKNSNNFMITALLIIPTYVVTYKRIQKIREIRRSII